MNQGAISGYAGVDRVSPSSVAAYFESHIEQGLVLQASNKTIGVVTGALGQRWFDVVVTGSDAHAGPTPMNLRRDAMLAASHIIQLVNSLALDHGPSACGTVGMMDVFPNSRNVIPGTVKHSIDLRADDDDILSAMVKKLHAGCAKIAKNSKVEIDLKQVVSFPPQAFSKPLVQAVRTNAQKLGLSQMDVVSSIGHDAVYLARVAPTAIILVPCKDGFSQNKIEDAKLEHLEAGCNVLLHSMLEQAL